MQREEARQCVGAGCGMAQMASTVKERGQVRLESSLDLRRPAGERERSRGTGAGGGVGAVIH